MAQTELSIAVRAYAGVVIVILKLIVKMYHITTILQQTCGPPEMENFVVGWQKITFNVQASTPQVIFCLLPRTSIIYEGPICKEVTFRVLQKIAICIGFNYLLF